MECGCWEKMIERNKINFFYLLGYYISLTLWVMGPGQVGALGRCPSCPGPGPGLFVCSWWSGGMRLLGEDD